MPAWSRNLLWALLYVGTSSCRCQREASERAPVSREPTALEAEPTDTFAYAVETFADVRILRYRVPDFDGLALKTKLLLYYLQEAALSGRDITYDQKCEHNLAVRRTLEAIVQADIDPNTGGFAGVLTYLKRVWFSNGIHHHYSSRKLAPENFTRNQLAGLIQKVPQSKLPLLPGEDRELFSERIVDVIFDPRIAPVGINKDPGSDPAADSANHFYVGLTRNEVQAYTEQLAIPGEHAPVSHGLNSQLVKQDAGRIEERPWKVDGMYGEALTECVRWLTKALDVCENDAQCSAIQQLITFYRTGNLRDFDRYNVAWVQDTQSQVDLIHGFIETYGDALNLRGTYEALVQLEDSAGTARVRTLSEQAQWFEAHSPIDERFKKADVVGITARAIQAVVAAGDSAPSMPIGVNLPNADWIREEHGSKSITLGNVLEAYEAASRDSGLVEEFALSSREVRRARKFGALAETLLVDMHEVIGHASGKLAEGAADPSESLGHYASTLEEARAELVALYFILDPKLIDLKLMPSYEVGRAAYDAQVRGSLLVQLGRVPLGQRLEEPHTRAAQLISAWCFAQGQDDGVIERVERRGKTFFVVRDYVKLRKLFGRLLALVQRLKSEGNLEATTDLIETYGVRVEPALHRQVRERFLALDIAPYAGFIQPELSPVVRAGEIVDVTISYPTDFTKQQLRYSARYSLLPSYN